MNSPHAIDPPESTRYACGYTFGEMKRRAQDYWWQFFFGMVVGAGAFATIGLPLIEWSMR